MSDIDFSLLNDFIVEANEHLDEMETQLLALRPGEDNSQLCNDIFRPIHTIKGASQFVGLDRVSSLSHRLEDLLDLLRSGQIDTTPDVLDVLIEGRDRIAALVKDLIESESERTDVDDLVLRITALIEGEDAASVATAQADAQGEAESEDGVEVFEGDLGDPFGDEFAAEAAAAFLADEPEEDESPERVASSRTAGGMELSLIQLNEDYDRELFEIYIEQLRDKIGLIGMLARALEGVASDRGILEEIGAELMRLRSSANYMGYEELVDFYDHWLAQLHQAISDSQAGSGHDAEFMAQAVNTLVNAVPELDPADYAIASDAASAGMPEDAQDEPAGSQLNPDEVKEFVDQSLEHLSDIEQGLLRYEQKQDNSVLDDVFRAAHTIKGVAQFVGLAHTAEIAHRMEDLLAQGRQGAPLGSRLITVLMAARDRLEKLVDDLSRVGHEATQVEDVLDALDRALLLGEDGLVDEDDTSIARVHTSDDEPYDKELYQIFITQLGEMLARIRSDRRRAAERDDPTEPLAQIAQQVRHLRHAANYMGYADLQQIYARLMEEVDAERFKVLNDQPISFDLIDRSLARIADIFPELATGDAEASAIATPVKSVAESIRTTNAEPSSTPAKASESTSSGPVAGEVSGEELYLHLTQALEDRPDHRSREFETLHGVFEQMLEQTEPEIKPATDTPVERKPAAVTAQESPARTEKPAMSAPRPAAPAVPPTRTKPAVTADAPQTAAASKVERKPGVSPAQSVNEATPVPAATRPAVPEPRQTPAVGESSESVAAATGAERGERVFKKSVRVDADKIDALMNQVGELIVDRSYFFTLYSEMHELQKHLKEDLGIDPKDLKQARLFTYRLGEAISALSRTSNDLQEGVMKVRMLPIAQIFNRYPRLIHDLTNRTNKRVELVIRGEDTELDKMIVEELSDPMIHIIRNAVDHGFETIDERKRMGKPEAGRLEVEAFQESNHIVIEVRDDGRGMDVNRIKAKALERKLNTKDELDRMSRRDLLRLTMTPGFSTAEKISRTSGRGVGMDVAKKNIEKLNGTIELDSEMGAGTRIRLKIPLTLAIIPALLVRVGTDSFTIPLSNVEETIRIREVDISTIEGTEVVHLRGRTMPIFRLASLFNLDSTDKQYDKSFVVVVNAGSEQVGLVVDELMGQEEVVIKPLVDYLQERSGFSGATIIGDGRISLILDVYELVNMTARRQVTRLRERDVKRGLKQQQQSPADKLRIH